MKYYLKKHLFLEKSHSLSIILITKDVLEMSDYEDLFKKFDENPVIQTPQPLESNQDNNFEDYTKQIRINRKMLVIYIVINLLVSLLSGVYFMMKYPNDLSVVATPTMTNSASGNPEYPFQITITATFRNDNSVTIPEAWLTTNLLSDTGEVIDPLVFEIENLEPGATFVVNYTAYYTQEIYSYSEFTYGYDETNLFYILINLSTVIICSLLFLAIDKAMFSSNWKAFKLEPGKSVGKILGGYVMVYAALFVASYIVLLLGGTDSSANEDAIASMFSQDPLTLVLMFLMLCVFTPIAEEVIYRKVIFGFFDRRFGPVAAIIISGAIFGLMHVISYGDFIQAIPYVFMGAIFGYVYYWSKKNIFVTIGVHFINNFISFLFYLLLAFDISIGI